MCRNQLVPVPFCAPCISLIIPYYAGRYNRWVTRVKICGITNSDDALAAATYGADLLGFNAVPESPRYVGEQQMWDAVMDLPPFIQTVVIGWQAAMVDNYAPDFVQYYHDNPDRPPGRRPVHNGIRCFRIKDAASLEEIRDYHEFVAAYLLDTYHKDLLGGSGETFNWELAVEAKRLTNKPIVLAGGLTPDNVQDAIATVRPYAVDVASGVESAPGIKDHAKVRAFIKAVRQWDAKFG